MLHAIRLAVKRQNPSGDQRLPGRVTVGWLYRVAAHIRQNEGI